MASGSSKYPRRDACKSTASVPATLMCRSSASSACSLVDQEDIGPDFEGQRDRFALSRPKLRSQVLIHLLHQPFLQPWGRRGRPDMNLCRRFRGAASRSKRRGGPERGHRFCGAHHIRMAQADKVIEWTGIGNNNHACDYRLFVVSNRSSVAMSLSRSSTA
jgi:hypothetical protein